MSTPVIEKLNVVEDVPMVDAIPEVDLSKKAHFISPAMNVRLWDQWGLSDPGGTEGVRMLVSMAAKAGEELVALCGYRWVPTGVPTDHGVCDACLDIANNWISQDES